MKETKLLYAEPDHVSEFGERMQMPCIFGLCPNQCRLDIMLDGKRKTISKRKSILIKLVMNGSILLRSVTMLYNKACK